MSRIQRALQNDFKALELLRGELVLHAHLLKADARKNWQDLEARWDDLKEHIQRAQTAAAGAEPDIEAAAQKLADALKSGYESVRNALRH